jgi:hypothetical protein
MTSSLEPAHARRYLLGEASEDERTAIEQQYFEREDALDQMAAVEDDLIEDYLSNQLDATERQQFEHRYLSIPRHRRRVDTMRRLITVASKQPIRHVPRARVTFAARRSQWLAAAAMLVLAVGGAWMFVRSRPDGSVVVDNQPPAATQPAPPVAGAQPTPAPAVRIFALALSPVAVRSMSESVTLVIPANTDIVAITLEGEPARPPFGDGRATIRTVGSDEVWQGPAIVGPDLPPAAIARIDVPAAALRPDDYVVTLFKGGTQDAGEEWSRYFLRVR